MMWTRRILGVDVGTSSIKIAQVVASIGGKKTLCRLAMCDGLESLAQLLTQKTWWKPGDLLHVSFPSERAIVRRLALPFRDPDKIQQTLPFELEGDVPLHAEEIVAGYLVQEKGPEGVELIALAASREAVEGWLDGFRTRGLDPTTIEPELAALARLVPRATPDPPQNLGVLEIGASKTNLLLFREGKVRTVRCIHGGLAATEGGMPLSENLVQEIIRTFTAIRARGDAPWPDALYLCGGLAAIPEAAGWLEARWGIPIRTLAPLEALPALLEEPTDAPPARFATAIGLTLSEGDRAMTTCNLRVGEFAYRPGLSMLRGRALVAVIMVLLAAGAGLGDLYARMEVRRKALEALQQETRTLFRQAFPDVSQIVDPVRQGQQALDEKKAKHMSLLAQDPRGTAVELLREIAVREQAKTLHLLDFDLSGDVISFRGEASGYDVIEKAKDHWAASPLLENVEIKSAKKNPKSQMWDFQCGAKRKIS